MGFILAAYLLAFDMPAFHLFWVQDGKLVESVEDYTLPECKAKANQFKKKQKAKCLQTVVTREYT